MNARLDNLVQWIRDGAGVESVGVLSSGERCYVALAAERYDLLPHGEADPIEAWYRLDADWRAGVCRWRGWPESYAHG